MGMHTLSAHWATHLLSTRHAFSKLIHKGCWEMSTVTYPASLRGKLRQEEVGNGWRRLTGGKLRPESGGFPHSIVQPPEAELFLQISSVIAILRGMTNFRSHPMKMKPECVMTVMDTLSHHDHYWDETHQPTCLRNTTQQATNTEGANVRCGQGR